MNAGTGLITSIEAYYDAAPRAAAQAETVGPFTLFVGRGAWGYYARPTLGLGQDMRAQDQVADVSADDVAALLARQRELDVAQEIEWQPSVTPSLEAACLAAGMTVHRYRLLVHDGSRPGREQPEAPRSEAPQSGADAGAADAVRMARPDDDLRAWLSVQQQGFGRPAEVDTGTVEHLAGRVEAGTSRIAAAFVDSRPVCVGVHQPVASVSEVVGVATLPEFRRRGWAGTLTTTLVDDAAALDVRTVFLSAADDAVACVYRRVGFRDVGMVCAAEPADVSSD